MKAIKFIAAMSLAIAATGCASTASNNIAQAPVTKAEHCKASAHFIAARQRMAHDGINFQDDQKESLYKQCMASL